MKQMSNYIEELQHLHHRRVNLILPAGALLVLLFAFLDYILVPEHFSEFLLYRELLVVIALGLLIFNLHDRKHNHPLTIGFLFYIAVSIFVIYTIHKIGGVNSPYTVGLILTMTVYTALAPLTAGQTLNACFAVIIFYSITISFTHPLHQPYLTEFLCNAFFMVSFSFIIATQSWANTRARKREYKLRVLENKVARDLHHHAKHLQKEVEKRSKEQVETEKRYRMLFDQIADDAIVITPSGKIIQTNKTFEQQYLQKTSATEISIYDVTPRRERPALMKLLKQMLRSGESVSGYRTSLIRKDLTITEAEMNASIVQLDKEATTVLLLMRDISTRKELEYMLFTSLEAKKKTESAAIMALAKLSEFRDVSSGHHLERIREYCKILALELSTRSDLNEVMTPTYIEDIFHASILHDIGKVAVPDGLLFSGEPVSERDRDTIRRHTIIGGDVIREMEQESESSGFLGMAKHIAYFHHEQWDGKGYPYGLMAREIPLAARIMFLADNYDDMTAHGEGTTAMIHKAAANAILNGSGTKFDPMVVEAFIARQSDFHKILEAHS